MSRFLIAIFLALAPIQAPAEPSVAKLELTLSAEESFPSGSHLAFDMAFTNIPEEDLEIDLYSPDFICVTIDVAHDIPMFMSLARAEAREQPLPSPFTLHAHETRRFEVVVPLFGPFWFTRRPALELLPVGEYVTGCSHELDGSDPRAMDGADSLDWRSLFLAESSFGFSVVPE